MPNAPEISVVLPVYNERDNLAPLLGEIAEACAQAGRTFEVICVDDHSSDGSLEQLRTLREARPWLRVVRHTANLGQSAALGSGFHLARAPIVVTMDADGQNDPADLPKLLAALGSGVAAVTGVRARREDAWTKRISSRVANRFRAALLGDHLRDAGCNFRALRREALRELPIFNGTHRFLASILRFQGHRVVELPIGHRPRRHGVSKYGVGNRLWRGLRDTLAMRWYRARCHRGDRWEPAD